MSKTELFARNAGGVFTFLDESRTTGDVFWVDSATGTDAAGYGYTMDAPVATIDYAVGLCTASKGDRIYVMPHHAENLTAATSLVVDVAGVQIIGLGYGSARPKLTYTTAAAATISVTAPSCLLQNLQLHSAFTNGITAGITVGALADGLRLRDIRMEEGASTTEFLIGISIAAACHDVGIDGFDFLGVAGGTDSGCIVYAGASNFSFIRNFRIFGDFSGAVIDGTAAASTFVDIAHGTIVNVDTGAGLSVSVNAATTGMMRHLDILAAKNAAVPVGAAMGFTQVLVSNAAGAQGFLQPVADT